jgi:hypothetical protein
MSSAHCRHGHPWNEENTRFNHRGDRYCIACQRAQSAAYRRKKGKKPRVVSLSNWCVCGHAMTPENTRVNSQGWRYCLACARIRDRKPRPVTPLKLQLIFDRLHDGETLNVIYGRKNAKYVGGGVTDRASLLHYMRQHPRTAKRIQALADKNRLVVRHIVHEGNRRRAAPALARNNGADAYEAIARATAHLWGGERGDVMSLMFLAAAEGRLLPRDAAARLPEFLREHRRQFGKWGPLSLDAPIFGDSTTTLGDTVTTGLWQ